MIQEPIIQGTSWTVSASFAGTDLTGWMWAITFKKRLSDLDTDAALKHGLVLASVDEIAACKFSHTFSPLENAEMVGNYIWNMKFIRNDGRVMSTRPTAINVETNPTQRTEEES